MNKTQLKAAVMERYKAITEAEKTLKGKSLVDRLAAIDEQYGSAIPGCHIEVGGHNLIISAR